MPLVALAAPLAEATLFTVGCAVIHAQRGRPERTTGALLCLAVMLALAVGVASLPVEVLQDQAYSMIENASGAAPAD